MTGGWMVRPQAVIARALWDRSLISRSATEAIREPIQTLPKHFIKLVIRPTQLLTSSQRHDRNHVTQSDDLAH